MSGKERRYELIDNQSSECVYFINNATQFYEAEDPYKNFQFTENSKTIDKKYLKYLDKAKELAKLYIDSSTVIYSEDKEELKNIIDNV